MEAGTMASMATLGSSAIQGIGAIQSSQSAAAAQGYNAKVAAQNAQIATTNSEFAGAQGEQNVAAAGAKTKADVAAITANQGASGVDINTGSAVDVRASEAKIGMLNALNVRSQAARAAYGYQVQAASDIGQAALDRAAQKSDKAGGYLQASADVLGGAGKAAMFMGSGGPLAGITDGPNQTELPWQQPGWGG